MTVIGPNFQENVKLWVNSFIESGIEDLETTPPTYRAVSPYWFLRGITSLLAEGSRDVRLMKSIELFDCNFSVTAKGILKPFG